MTIATVDVVSARSLATGAPAVVVRALGPTPYVECWRAMRAFTDAREASTPDELWLTEHEPVYTLGLAGRAVRCVVVADAAERVVLRLGAGGKPERE